MRYLREQEVAEITGRAVPTLRNERHRGEGIPYIKIGRSVRYSEDDVVKFMESRKVTPRLTWQEKYEKDN